MVEVQIEKKCKRPGCNKKYTDADNDGTKCSFHSGQPIFHDLKKGWSCCNKIVYDWDEFQKIPGCCTGAHTDDPNAASGEFWKSQTVQSASDALERERLASLKTAADFNKEEE